MRKKENSTAPASDSTNSKWVFATKNCNMLPTISTVRNANNLHREMGIPFGFKHLQGIRVARSTSHSKGIITICLLTSSTTQVKDDKIVQPHMNVSWHEQAAKNADVSEHESMQRSCHIASPLALWQVSDSTDSKCIKHMMLGFLKISPRVTKQLPCKN